MILPGPGEVKTNSNPYGYDVLNSTFAVVQLLDYAQVPVRHNSTDLTYYGSVGANETCSVHLSVKAPDSPGPHRLAIVTTIGPYEDV